MIVSRDRVDRGFAGSDRGLRGPVMLPDLEEMWVRWLMVYLRSGCMATDRDSVEMLRLFKVMPGGIHRIA